MTPFLVAAIAEMLPNAGRGATCEECGFDWSLTGDAARTIVRDAPRRFAWPLAGDDEPAVTGAWSPSAYVWHVGDLVRMWAERLHSLATDPSAPWVGVDPDVLAAARGYAGLPPRTAPWALARSCDALHDALGPLDLEVRFEHPEWGHGTVADALRWLAHEVVHHELDVRRASGTVDAS